MTQVKQQLGKIALVGILFLTFEVAALSGVLCSADRFLAGEGGSTLVANVDTTLGKVATVVVSVAGKVVLALFTGPDQSSDRGTSLIGVLGGTSPLGGEPLRLAVGISRPQQCRAVQGTIRVPSTY